MATPSTTPRRSTHFISEPVESPFPYAASPSPLTKSLTSPQHNHNTNEPPSFSPTQIREITTIFQLFNPTLSGYLDIDTFEVMMLSLGYRVTSQDVVDIMHDISSCSSSSSDPETTEAINNQCIDLSMAMKILARKGYATKQRNSEDEMRIYFRLFDVSDRGFITVEDLKRVLQETVQLEREMMLTNSDSSSIGTVTDEFVQAIVQKFDLNSTGVIDFEEFAQIVHPIISVQ